MFSQEEEAMLVEHIKAIAAVGYGYSRAEVINVASEYAVCLQKRDRENPLSYKWFYAFMKRWPELKIQSPKSMSELRAKASSRESIESYFKELNRICTKYNLHNKPQNIYNVDEKGIQQNFKPPKVVGSADRTECMVMSERSSTTTLIGCGNALGQQIPPFFVFAGSRMRQELLQGASLGADGTVSKSGWSNGDVFRAYLENHFLKFAVKGSPDAPLLLLYDGHRSHISPAIIEWAQQNDIILYVLPPHTSHILQPMDVGCFGPFTKIYGTLCNKFQRSTGSSVGKYNVCEIACKAYSVALSAVNLQSAFRKSGVFPIDPEVVDATLFETAKVRKDFQEPITTGTSTEPMPEEQMPQSETAMATSQIETTATVLDATKTIDVDMLATADRFFKKKRPTFVPPIKTKERRSISKLVSGQAITEQDISDKVKAYYDPPCAKKIKFQPPLKSVPSSPKKTTKTPTPGPSGLQRIPISDSDSEDGTDADEETCCVCNKFSPDAMRNLPYITFASWGKCDFDACTHWVHLKFCCPVRAIRRHDRFYCPCHGLPWNGVEE